MTVEEHVRVGLALGYPRCCVMQFAADRILNVLSGAERGGVHLGRRTGPAKVFRERDGFAMDPHGEEIIYVPCDDCSGPHTEGWRSHRRAEELAA